MVVRGSVLVSRTATVMLTATIALSVGGCTQPIRRTPAPAPTPVVLPSCPSTAAPKTALVPVLATAGGWQPSPATAREPYESDQVPPATCTPHAQPIPPATQ